MVVSTVLVIIRFAKVSDTLRQVESLVEVDVQSGDCLREIYDRTCNIDYWWECAEYLLSIKQNSIDFEGFRQC